MQDTQSLCCDIYSEFTIHGYVLDSIATEGLGIHHPKELRTLLSFGSEWHICRNHYGVFGCNLMNNGQFLCKADIIGEDIVGQWYRDHPQPNCASKEYECMGAVSEFDYLFVNTDPSSKQCGETRLLVNNCFEEGVCTPAPFSNFLVLVLKFAKEYNESYDTNEQLEFRNFLSRYSSS